MKKLLLLILSLLIGIGLFVWVLKTVGGEAIENAFLVFVGWQGLVILGLTLLMAVVGTWKWQEILKGGEVSISFKKLFNPYLAGFALIYLAPIIIWAGEIFRGYILKERHSVPWSKGMASVIIDRILEWTANLTVIFFGGIFFFLTIGLSPIKLGIIFGAVFLIFLLFVAFFSFKSAKRESIIRFFLFSNHTQPFEIEKEIFDFFKLKKIAMWKAISLSFLRAAIMYFRAWLLVSFLGRSVGALPALSILGFNYLAVMIPIPAALGSHEAIQTFAFNSLGLGASTAAAFTMIVRGAELIVASVGLIILFRLGIILFKNNLFKKINKLSKISGT